LLVALSAAGFDHVVATPHMRPGMFDNTRSDLVSAFEKTCVALQGRVDLPAGGLPKLGLASEHFFDDVVFARFLEGDVLPYPGGHAALVEFPPRAFPTRVQHRFFDLMRRRVRPVLAHPERYEPVWNSIECLDPLIDAGAVLQLDVAALAGKYGRAPRKAAEALLDEGYYYAASSDAHRPGDVEDVRRGIDELVDRVGEEEARFLLIEGPTHILEGRVET
jgi:protein-tyrosine phosphatase